MSELKAIAWKEWHEIRAFLWIGLGVFLGLPLIGALEALHWYSPRFEVTSTPWVLTFGGVLAVFVAVGATTRDFSGHLPDFWQSRPVNIVRWLFVKYGVGLLVVLVACVLPICVDLYFSQHRKDAMDATFYLAWLPFMWTAMYSLAFLVGVLVRRMAHAAMLGLAAMLLVYFLPVVLPPLEWMNVARIIASEHLFTAEKFEFGAGMFGVAGVALVVALLAARRDWRIESGPMMMYGSISAALLILLASAAFQLGTNLPILQTADLLEGETIFTIRCDGTQGYILTEREFYSDETPVGASLDPQRLAHSENFLRSIKLTPTGIEIGNATKADYRFTWDFYYASLPDNPRVNYYVDGTMIQQKEHLSLRLGFPDEKSSPEVAPLWEREGNDPWPVLEEWHNRLYVVGTHLMTLDISQPLKPRVLSDTPFAYKFLSYHVPAATDVVTLELPDLPGLPARQRLETAVKHARCCGLEGDIFCEVAEQGLVSYRLTNLTDAAATFEKIGEYEPTILEKVFGFNGGGLQMKNGLAYLTEDEWGHSFFNSHMTVFDVTRPGKIKSVGHFAAPGADATCLLPDGRALVGGSKLWLVGAPPKRAGD